MAAVLLPQMLSLLPPTNTVRCIIRTQGLLPSGIFLAKKQIFQLKSSTLSKDQVSAIADQAIAKLEAGQSEDQVKQWAREQM